MPSAPSRRWVLALAALATFMVALDNLVVTTALTEIQRDLDASVAQLEWTVNGYSLTFAVLILTASALGDRFGRRRMFAGGLGLFTVASAACALAPDAETLIAARVVQGAGAAAVFPLALTLAVSVFPADQRGTALGLLGGLTGLAVACGPLVGGAIVDGLEWSWIFWVNVPIGIAAVAFTLIRIPESRVDGIRLDLPGAALATVGTLGIVWALVRGNIAGWTSAEVLASAAAGVVVLLAFARSQATRPHAMLPRRLFTDRAFAAGNLAGGCMIAALFGAVFLMAQYFQTVQGDDPLTAGLRLLPWTATPMVVAPLAGIAADRVGARPILLAGLALQAIGLAWIGLIADASTSYGQLVLPLLTAGVGVSMAIPAAQTAVLASAGDEDLGRTSGTNATLRELGGVLGIAVTVAVFAGSGDLTPAGFAEGFGPALLTAGALSGLGIVAALAIPRTSAPRDGAPATTVTA